MKKIALLFAAIIFSLNFLPAQDIDFYHKTVNDQFYIPAITSQMSADEFQLLSRSLRMKDFMYATVVPGYVHFQAKDHTTGYILLAARLGAYSALTYESIKYGYDFYKIYLFQTLNINTSASKTDFYIINFATSVIIGSLIFDWIHGQARLHKKQELIRYKYALKMQLYKDPAQQKVFPAFNLQVKF